MKLTHDEIIKYIDKVNKELSKSYTPYSNFPVAALILDENNNEYMGVNVENASYGLSVCAERNTIFYAVYKGMKKIRYIFVTGNVSKPISPCGACRQVIKEFSDENTVIILANSNNYDYKILTMEELLPYGFKF